jgi:hydrogenase small subunit
LKRLCGGESIVITAAMQPSLEEDVVLGAIPWIPAIKFHDPVLAYEVGDDFLRKFYLALEGKLSPFILVAEGSIPDQANKSEGYWSSFGTDPQTGQAITVCVRVD